MINVSKWKEFKLSDLFEFENCKCSNASELDDGEEIEYIGAKKTENGHMKFVRREDSLVTKGNCILFICDGQGSVGYTLYMPDDFIGSTTTCAGYNPNLNFNIGMFLVTVLDLERPKYSFGRKYRTHLKDTLIKLPADKEGNPDWKHMNDFIESVQLERKSDGKPLKSSLKTKNKDIVNIDSSEWRPFTISDLFEVKYGVNLELSNCNEEVKEVNFVARTAENNGISARVETIAGLTPQDAGLISVAGGGSVLSTFYQDEPFYSGRDLYTLRSKDNIDKYAKLFIVTLIKMEKFKYSYGRQANKTLPFIEIRLPVDSEGKPNYEFMSRYIKSLPYGDRI